MDLSNFSLVRLSTEIDIKPFDCKDTDLNDFLLNNAQKFQSSLLAVTYLLESDTETVAFFSLFNDKVAYQDFANNNQWKKFRKGVISPEKQFRSYPAVKIGRLAVTESYKGKEIGSKILDYLKGWLMDNNRTGCKFITVDAYDKSLKFYEKNEFKYLTNDDLGKDTRVMYFDLLPLT
jgi:GNAT superfamily N-acetyltransferase